MIVVKLQGGLGNQMFQYATGYAFSKKFNKTLVLECSFLNRKSKNATHTYRQYGLNAFCISASTSDLKYYSRYYPPLSAMEWIFHNIKKILGKNSFLAYNDQNIQNITKTCNPIYLEGYWQNENYFKPYRDYILREFRPQKCFSPKAKAVLQQIKDNKAVSVHIRRGDYVSNPTYFKSFGTCGISYYKVAMNLINKKVDAPHFFVFSDDINWAKSNLTEKKVTFVDKGNAPWEDIILMTKCRHNIVANSTFSWWGAWLNKNPGKIVIAPKKWFAEEGRNQRQQIVPDEWIKV